jgi:hypothetical protein
MQAMQRFSAVASRRALSVGTVLVFAGGLALYQMTSLVLGPAGSRELHLSLTIPAVEDERSEPKTSGAHFAIGTLVSPGPAASVSVPSTAWERTSGAARARHRTTPAPLPVGSLAPVTHPSGHPVPPTIVPKDEEAD